MQDYYNSDELMHYGRKGMKWGQNIFGKVKSGAGKVKAKIDANRAEKKRIKAVDELRSKPLRYLTDEELKLRTSRAQAEKNLRDLEKQTETVKAGESFIKAAGKQVVGPALITAGKNVLTKWFEKKGFDLMGMGPIKDEFEDLKKSAEKARLDREIAGSKRKEYEDRKWLEKKQKEDRDAEQTPTTSDPEPKPSLLGLPSRTKKNKKKKKNSRSIP